MGRGLKNPKRRYALNQCPLYGAQSKAKVAKTLNWEDSAASLVSFARRETNYREFKDEGRDIQAPKDQLERVQRRLANLLVRLNVPEYLHSGVKGRSYVSNAKDHANAMPAIKVDIEKFYVSTTRDFVMRWFCSELRCSQDVAAMLTTIACWRRKFLPTGSPLSQILAFHVHRRMFDTIDRFVKNAGGVLSVYVDDISISMPNANWSTVKRVGRMIERQGLRWHKPHVFRRGQPKFITGTIAKATHLEALNSRHAEFMESLKECEALAGGAPTDEKTTRYVFARTAGLLETIDQVDERKRQWASGFRAILSALRTTVTRPTP